MTKEERPIIGILKKYSSEVNNWNDAVFSDKFEVVENDIINVMQEYADQQTKDKDISIEKLVSSNLNIGRKYDELETEITQLKQQLKEKSEEVERLRNEVFKVWNEDNGSVQMNTPIAWYRVLRIAEELNNQ